MKPPVSYDVVSRKQISEKGDAAYTADFAIAPTKKIGLFSFGCDSQSSS